MFGPLRHRPPHPRPLPRRPLHDRPLRRRRFGGPTTRILLCATALVVGGVAMAGPALAVAHGEPVPTGRYGFAVKLTMTDIPRPDGSHYNSACSAALVAPNWIITAGHCFHDVNRAPVGGPVPYATTATVGRTDLADSTGHVVDVVEVVQAAGRDVALGRLDARIVDVRPVRIERSAPRVGAILRIAGWGDLSPANPVPATHLQTGQVQVSSVTATTVGVHGYAPAADTSACVYDSGAPYFVEHRGHEAALVSVESNGPTCPHAVEETTVRVDDIAGWISATVHRRG